MQSLATYGTLIVFTLAFANQMGLPLAGEIVFLQLGALAARGRLGFGTVLVAPVLGTILANLCLYSLGRRSGLRLLSLISRYSLDPDRPGSDTTRRFGRSGLNFLLVSQFFPLTWSGPVLSGINRIAIVRFYAYSSIGALLWVATYVTLGFLGFRQIEAVVDKATQVIGTLGGVAAVIIVVYAGLKLVRRRRILRVHRQARISPDRLKARMDAGEPVVILDVRTLDAIEQFPFVIPGARVIPAEQIDGRRSEIPVDQDLVVYCSCANELGSARVALKLNKEGLGRIHSLEGGIDAWRALAFPVEARIPAPLGGGARVDVS